MGTTDKQNSEVTGSPLNITSNATYDFMYEAINEVLADVDKAAVPAQMIEDNLDAFVNTNKAAATLLTPAVVRVVLTMYGTLLRIKENGGKVTEQNVNTTVEQLKVIITRFTDMLNASLEFKHFGNSE